MSEIKYCPQCGAKIEEGGNFCPACGCRLNEDGSQTESTKPAQQINQKEYDGFAIASLACGIAAFFVFAIICGILAIVFGTVSKSHGYTSRMATIGRILGIVAIAVYIIGFIVGFSAGFVSTVVPFI